MATQTTNLNLTKPELSDNMTPTIFAENFDIIDNAIAGKQPTITGAATSVVSNNLTANKVVVTDSNGKLAAGATALGTQCTFTLSGTTLTITMI